MMTAATRGLADRTRAWDAVIEGGATAASVCPPAAAPDVHPTTIAMTTAAMQDP
jgi:hypothetical protein